MNENKRWGHFTSSEIWKLMTKDKSGKDFGKAALTYINHVKWELKLGRSITVEASSKATIWGQYAEAFVHKKLGLEYKLCSTERIVHPEISLWSGAPDCITNDAVCDIKCPELITFCGLLDAFENDNLKKEYPEYYWQLISNAILTGKDFAELIPYVPYNTDLGVMRMLIEEYDGDIDLDQLKRIYYAPESTLAYLPDGCKIKDLHVFRFPVPNEDKEALTDNVIKAIEKLAA